MNNKHDFEFRYLAAFLFLLAFGVYWNSLSNGFVYDDKFVVLVNHWITDATYIPEILFNDTWGFSLDKSSSYYRPVMLVLYMMIYHLFRFAPWGFHLANVLIHAGVSVLVFVVARRLLDKTDDSRLSAPFFTAALFATHPVHTEAVAWVSGIPDLSFTFFYLLSFWFYMISTKEGKISGGFHLLSVFSFFLAALSKEPALTLPVILVAYDYAFNNVPRRFVDASKRYLPYIAAAGVYLVLRVTALGGFAPVTRHADLTGYQYFLNVFPLFAYYLGKLVLPVPLNAYHVFHPANSIFEPVVVLSIGIFLAFSFILYFARKRDKIVFLCLLFLSVPLIPALYIPAVGENVFAERYLYLPSFGFLMLPPLLLERAGTRQRKWTIPLLAGLILLAGLYSLGTIRRNTVWRSDYSLWTDTVRKSPDGSVPHNNLGNAYKEKGLIDKAIEEYRIAIQLDPNNSYARVNLGSSYQSRGLMENAIEEYRIAINLNPRIPEAHNNLGVAYKSQGMIDKAIAEYKKAITINPEFPEAHNNLGNAYKSKGFIDQAINEYRIAVMLNRDYYLAYYNLGDIYQSQGLFDRAVEYFEETSRIKPDWELPHHRLGMIYLGKGDVEKARRRFETVLQINPRHIEARKFHNIIVQRER